MKTNSGMNDKPEAAVFEAALACATPQERAAYLDKACAGQPELRQRVEALLAAHEEASNFLEPKPDVARPTIRLTLPPEEQPGERIGRYKLLQKIGEGGCGVVYMAEQEEPVRRRVALKVIKLGMDTKQVVARFEAERQALALMDHPNIAKVLDAGATDAGRPFFVMELVKGIPATRYADENKLDTRQRLDLFIQICQAVQHAHQKGIIHRDIKPSNVLVADHDGTPVPKVIDFGIAKATTDQRLTDKTLFTALEQFIGTPAYMSPEQAKLSGLDVDTRSDIYSLGVLLYELLTGKTPFDARRLLDAGFDEIRRIIREEEPQRPSTRLSTLDAAEQTNVAKQRQSEPPKLVSIVRGDLDWIVMKCLEKDRTRRYETANGLAADVQRHLSNEPVVACPPSAAYRFQKMVRRNRVVFMAASTVTVAILLGSVISTWSFFREKAASQSAKREAMKSEQLSRFLKEMIEAAGPEIALGRDTVLLKEILSKTENRLEKNLTKYPEVEAELHQIIGNTFRKTQEFEKAEPPLRRALKLRSSCFGVSNLLVAESMTDLARILVNKSSPQGSNALPAEAEELAREAMQIRTALLQKRHPDTIQSMHVLASSLFRQNKFDEAEQLFREVIRLRREVLGNAHPDLASALMNLGWTLIYLKKYAECETVAREAVAIEERNYGADNPDVSDCIRLLCAALNFQGRFPETIPWYRKRLTIEERYFPKDHPRVLDAVKLLASELAYVGNTNEAAALKEGYPALLADPKFLKSQIKK